MLAEAAGPDQRAAKKMRPRHCTKKNHPGSPEVTFLGTNTSFAQSHPTLLKKYLIEGKHCHFTGTVLWYYHRAWVTCGHAEQLCTPLTETRGATVSICEGGEQAVDRLLQNLPGIPSTISS